jgi:exosortase/archaeosortase family protein
MMKKFLMLYFGSLILLFIVFYFPTNPVAVALNNIQTDLTLRILQPFLDHDQLHGHDIWIDRRYKIVVNHACNGFIPLFLLWAAIIAFPAKTMHKIVWMFVSYLFFTAVNSLRILIVVYMAEKNGGEKSFFIAHDLFGNVILIISGAAILFMYLRTRGK